ncbi:S10 family peptidase [Glacieibacterium megasporae]|uniref:S10 family peptidase n=1 Tax=Glacieibacterium megasporae TaxID=2835787 RepID=UPI00210381C9|nr:peptidase S10 [Polymorphobacter megasporae]
MMRFAVAAFALASLTTQAFAQERPVHGGTTAGAETPRGAARRGTTAEPDEAGRGDATNTQPAGDPRAARARENKLGDSDVATAPIRELRVPSRHTATIGGRSIAYTATAGTVTIRDDDGKPTASMFYVAYTTGDPGRPVTFLYNGGPGSSTLWLHMGSLAPVRVRTDSPGATAGPPFQLVNNPDSLLDKSDLVFVDAIGAGFSRPLGDTKLQSLWGTDADIDAFARGIERWLTINDRWNSPKFIFGESYGTTRSGGLSYRLAQDGVQLNGVVLLSSIMNYGRRAVGLDQDLINYLPSYAATAAYHHRIPAPADLPAFLAQARAFSRGPYAQALAQGQDLPDAERSAIAQQMAGFTGLPVKFILDSDLRVDLGRFRKELLRDQRRTLGRYDSRFTGIDVDAAAESPEFDPSDTGITGAFVSSFHHYLAHDLGFTSDMAYRPTYYSQTLKWDFNHRAPGQRGGGATTNADTALDLSAAMRENPHLLVYSLNGIYDMATPFFGTEYDLGHMQIDRTLRPNLRFAYYPSGHMVYLNTEALHSMKADLARFYDDAAPR